VEVVLRPEIVPLGILSYDAEGTLIEQESTSAAALIEAADAA
jgi:hypothetical protein